MTLYQEREFHRRRLAQLEQQALETQNHTDAETNILRAQLAGARQEIDWGHQQRERLEEQLQEVNLREQKAQQDLQTSRDDDDPYNSPGRCHTCHRHTCHRYCRSNRKSTKHASRVRGRYCHNYSVHGPDDKRESISHASAPTGFPQPSGWVSTLLGNVPLPVPSVCATNADRVSRREPDDDEHLPVDPQHRTRPYSTIWGAPSEHTRRREETFTTA